MKKLVCVLLVVILALLMLGCKVDSEPEPVVSNPVVEKEETVVEKEPEPVKEVWPNADTKDITVVIPFTAGGTMDVNTRLLCNYWSKYLGVNFVFDNRPGANSQVGTTYFLSLKDEDTPILASPQPFLSSSVLLQGADYAVEDIAIINFSEIDPATISVSNESPYQTFEELDAAIKANPGKFKIGASAGGGAAIATAMLIEKSGWDVKTVLYDGGANLRTALMGGHVDAATVLLETSIKDMESYHILAVCDNVHYDAIPDVPLFSEILGEEIPVLGTARYIGVSASFKEKYPDRYQVLVDTLEQTYQDPEYLQALKDSGLDAFISWRGPEASAEMNIGQHEMTIEYLDALSETAGN